MHTAMGPKMQGRTTTSLIEGRRVVGAAAIEHRRCQPVRRRIDGDANRSLEKQLPNKGTPAPLHAGALAATAAAAALAAAYTTDAGALASHPGTLLGAGAIETLDVEAHSASVAPVEPAATNLTAAGAEAVLPRGRGRGRQHHGELVLRVQRAPHLRREHGAERVHVEAARHAAVDESPPGARRGAQVADAVVVGDAAEGEAVPRVRGEGDRRLEVVGAGLVDVEVAGLAPEPDEAAEAGGAEVADMAGVAAVLAPHQDVLRVGAVSPVFHKGGLKMCKYRCCKTWLACALAGCGYKCQTIEARNGHSTPNHKDCIILNRSNKATRVFEPKANLSERLAGAGASTAAGPTTKSSTSTSSSSGLTAALASCTFPSPSTASSSSTLSNTATIPNWYPLARAGEKFSPKLTLAPFASPAAAVAAATFSTSWGTSTPSFTFASVSRTAEPGVTGDGASAALTQSTAVVSSALGRTCPCTAATCA
uniref:Uncharacterized protein n=1 Tax=Oryza glumipatula TaxID=40148 RepID=A0A0E0AMJ2_9ORYZ